MAEEKKKTSAKKPAAKKPAAKKETAKKPAAKKAETPKAEAKKSKPEAQGPKLVKASLSFSRQTPRKLRRTANLIRNMKAGEAVTQLKFMPYAASTALRKLLQSAIANASSNFSIEKPEELQISQLLVDEATVYKRFRAQSKGRGVPVLKRNSKLSLVLSEFSPAEYSKHVRETSPRFTSKAKKETVKA